MPTIRIDEGVYRWLQDQARPFEDTPNSVLRRLARLEEPPARNKSNSVVPYGTQKDQSTMPARPITGRQLNEEWKVGAKHPLFHRDGTWYNNLKRFPGALFDPNGYVLFPTEEDYRGNSRVHIGKQTNVPNGISSLSNYVRVTNDK